MKTAVYCGSLFLAFTACFLVSSAQKVPPVLQQRLAGKTRLVDIMKEVDAFYENGRSRLLENRGEDEGEEFENAYIHWKRFEYFHASRLDANGNIRQDIARKIWDGFNQYASSHPGAFSNARTANYSYGSWGSYGPTSITRYGTGYNSGHGR